MSPSHQRQRKVIPERLVQQFPYRLLRRHFPLWGKQREAAVVLPSSPLSPTGGAESFLPPNRVFLKYKKEYPLMRAVLTRVKSASVSETNSGELLGRCGRGFLVLLGVHTDDTEAEAAKIADKLCGLRIFEDEHGKMNVSPADAGAEMLIVSQFTLYADAKSRRPGFTRAARPDTAIPLYEKVISLCRERGFHVETGRFGADMQVTSVNDGPVTIFLDTKEL